ncbi:MAG: hypothetical protein HY330_00605 [Chloroflexi bacterium]|nr:hypothetical protein [Chloroflexota bacterium]
MAGLLGMFGGSRSLRPEVKAAIQSRHGLNDKAFAELKVVESSSKFAGRPVTYFRIFKPAEAVARGLQVKNFADLNEAPALVIYEGHEEMDTRLVSLKGPDRPTAQP